MFKSILPLRRIHSSEFDMLTDLDANNNDKENYPALSVVTNTGKSVATEKRTKKAKVKHNSKDEEMASPDTEQAFTQLLVRASHSPLSDRHSMHMMGRMSSRFLQQFDPSWLPWNPP